MKKIEGIQFQVSEWSYSSEKQYSDPFNDVELDVLIMDSENKSWRVPTFWTRGHEWRVRFAPPEPKRYTFKTECSDKENGDLHAQEGILEAAAYANNNPLLKHGPLRVAKTRRTFEFADGTPFFWLGDTWWYGLCKRWSWPDDFKAICKDRLEKGFNVVQIVAGLPCDAREFDDRAANEGGYVWEKDYLRINPAYFEMADRRIQYLVEAGILPCIVGSWGYYILMMGTVKMKKHWRYIIARWGAYPAVWCLAGEATLPYYQKAPNNTISWVALKDYFKQKREWTEVARYVREINYSQRLISIHPFPIPFWYRIFVGGYKTGRTQIKDSSLLDYEMLQTGHFERELVKAFTATSMRNAYTRKPTMPVINAEVVYEGHMQQHFQEMQRLMFWLCILNGAAGHTYGAGGIWECNARDQPFGASPHAPIPHVYENTPWDEAMHLPGSKQLGLGKSLLERYRWWLMKPHPEWSSPHWTRWNPMLPYAAGIPGELRIIYIPQRIYNWSGPLLKKMEPEVNYHAFYFNPINGDEYDLGRVSENSKGQWQAPEVPICQDWVLILEKKD